MLVTHGEIILYTGHTLGKAILLTIECVSAEIDITSSMLFVDLLINFHTSQLHFFDTAYVSSSLSFTRRPVVSSYLQKKTQRKQMSLNLLFACLGRNL